MCPEASSQGSHLIARPFRDTSDWFDAPEGLGPGAPSIKRTASAPSSQARSLIRRSHTSTAPGEQVVEILATSL